MNKKNIIFLIVLIKYVKSNDDEGEPTYDSPLSIDCTC